MVPCPGYDVTFVEIGEDYKLVVMFPDGSSKSVVHTEPDLPILAPMWSPDGRSIAFYRGGIARIDIGFDYSSNTFIGSGFTLLSREGWDPAWSPLGNEIAAKVSPTATRGYSIGLIPAIGGSMQILYTAPAGHTTASPTWGAFGTQIAFVEVDALGVPWIKVLERATGRVVRTISLGGLGTAGSLDWAREGSDLLAFDTYRDSVYILNMTDGRLTRVTEGAGPSWSPDNTKILYAELDFGISIIDLASGAVQSLSRGGWMPDWNWFGSAAEADATPPASVTDLAVDSPNVTYQVVPLTWSATGDDGTVGNAFQYDLRYLPNEPVTDSNWNRAIQASGEPAPLPSGERQRLTVEQLRPETKYSFALRAIDEWANPSALSNVAEVTTPIPPPGAWVLETVDPKGDTGGWLSMDLDDGGNPHIGYLDETNGDVKYARWTGSGWQIQTVPDPSTAVGYWTSLVLDRAGYPRIVYFDYEWSAQDLKYARWDGLTWTIETVDHRGVTSGAWNSIVLDAADNPHVAYRQGGSNGALMYARRTDSGWVREVADPAARAGAGGTSIALTVTGQPRIAYHADSPEEGLGKLGYAAWTAAGWALETVDALPGGDVGAFPSLQLDPLDRPHISYYDEANGDLKYARWSDSGWAIEVVDREGIVGLDTSFALDVEGRPHIAYYDETQANPKYARWTGSSWVTEAVDERDRAGRDPSLQLAPDGVALIAYYDITNGDLDLARKTPEVVDPIDVAFEAPWAQLAVGQRMDLRVTATVHGAPLEGGLVIASVSSGGTLDASSGTTDGAGTWTTAVMPGLSAGGTDLTVSVRVSKYPHASGTASLPIQILSEALPLRIIASSNRIEMMSYETATINVRLDSDGIGVSTARITAMSPSGGNLSAVAELGSGEYALRWDAPLVTVQTFASVILTAKVGGYADARTWIVLLVDPNKTNTDAQLFLIAEPEKSVLRPGETIHVTVFVFTIEGFQAYGATIRVRLFDPSLGQVSDAVNVQDGMYRFAFTASAEVMSPTGLAILIETSKLGFNPGFTRIGLLIAP